MLQINQLLRQASIVAATACTLAAITPYAQIKVSPVRNVSWSVPTFRPETLRTVVPQLHLALDEASRIRIKIVGPDGRLVRTLLRDVSWEQGLHSVPWDGKDDAGRTVPGEAYSPFIETEQNGKWLSAFNPSAANHGCKADIVPLQWDPVTGKLALHVKAASRIKVWVVRGDDGWIVGILKDMEPVQAGFLSLSWSAEAVQARGAAIASGFHFTGYELPKSALIIEGNGLNHYLQVRDRYPIEPVCQPKTYEDSSVLYRYELLDQKALRFEAALSGDTLTIIPDALFAASFRENNPEVRFFFQDGSWLTAMLQRREADSQHYIALLDRGRLNGKRASSAIVYTAKDQYGCGNLNP